MTTKSELGQQALSLADGIHRAIQEHMEELKAFQNDLGAPWTSLIAKRVFELLGDYTDMRNVDFVEGRLGLLGLQEHCWFELSLSPEESGERDFRFIIDPCVPDCYPNILVVGPRSPLKSLYRKK